MTSIKLLNVPFESNYKDTVYFASKTAQTTYMDKRIVKTFNNVTYQRKDNIIRIPAHIDTLYNCNYVAYTNEPYTNHIFYAFIVDMQYVNDGRTDITIKTDVMQTWAFDYTVKQSFVEREHTSNDAIGLNTYPEGLETGEFISDTGDEYNYVFSFRDLAIVWGATKSPDKTNVGGNNYNGIYSGVRYYYASTYMAQTVTDKLKEYDENGIGDAITCMFIAPLPLCVYNKYIPPIEDVTTDFPWTGEVEYSGTPYQNTLTEDVIGERKKKFGAYTPKNNKLLSFPYKYLSVNNNNGGDAIYKYEMFKNGVPSFKVQGALTPGCSIRLIPMNYNGITENDFEGLNLGKYPICNWNSDVYTNWLTQNSVNIGLQIASGVGQVIGGVALGVATGGVGLAVGGSTAVAGVSTIANTLSQIHQQSFTPPQSKGNLNCGDVVTSANKNNFHFNHMSIKEEYARIIDDFFTMFGYKTNRVKVPNKNHRPYFWYTKTIDVNIDGAIPNKDMDEIKQCYNNGITFWKDSATMGDYSVNNSPNV